MVRFLFEHKFCYYIINGLVYWNTCKEGSRSYETSSYLPELVKLFIKTGRVNVSLIANSFLDKALRYFASPLEALYIKCPFDQLSNKVLDAQHLFLILY